MKCCLHGTKFAQVFIIWPIDLYHFIYCIAEWNYCTGQFHGFSRCKIEDGHLGCCAISASIMHSIPSIVSQNFLLFAVWYRFFCVTLRQANINETRPIEKCRRICFIVLIFLSYAILHANIWFSVRNLFQFYSY